MDQANVKVSFYLKKSEADADGMCPVMAKLNIGKYSEAAFSVKFRVPQSMWNSGRASGKSVKAKEINNRLDEIRAMALGVYTELSAVRDGVTAGDVKNLLLGMAGEQATLLSYFRTFIENFAKRVGVNRTEGSLRSYRNACNHVERFLREKYNLSDIPFSALNRSFIDDYDSHLRTDCRLAPGTIINLTVQLKIIVGEAVADGIITTYPFAGYEPVRPKQKRRYLTSEELQRLMTTPLHKPNLYLTRDLFLFSCYTGIPYSDMRLLSKEHLSLADDGTWWIRSSRRKTGVGFEIPLLDLPLRIMEKYMDTASDGRLLPMYSNSTMNLYLKRIAQLCDIGCPLVFHAGRHTYATEITLGHGVPLETVSKMLGHARIETTQIYAKVTDDKINADTRILNQRIAERFSVVI
ncbi:MAG: site-specific integrase [Bacteroides sp.]|nr:site-specific integrase [Bacteroides sp.]MCM1388825.1 site-specific integrase [Bacteroides sp.]